MKIADNKTLIMTLCMVVFITFCLGCYEEPLDSPREEHLRPGQLTVEEAYDLFREYACNINSRSLRAGDPKSNLDPGVITAIWEEAALSTTSRNSFVNVPIRTVNDYSVKSPLQ